MNGCFREMLEYVLNISTNVFCLYCSSREGHCRGAVLRSICKSPGCRPRPHCTGRGQLNEGVMFSEWKVLLCVCSGVCMVARVNVAVVRKEIFAAPCWSLFVCLLVLLFFCRCFFVCLFLVVLVCVLLFCFVLFVCVCMFCHYSPRQQGLRSETAWMSICQAS